MTTALSDSGLQLASGNILDLKAAMPTTGSYTIGDIVLEVSAANRLSGWKRQTTGSNNVLGTDWLYFNMPVNPQSMVRLNTANGYGSTNTKIMRFTNVTTNQGSDITYADSATLGASFTINTSGVYSVSAYGAVNAAANVAIGASLNSSQLTTNIQSITTADALFYAGNPAGAEATCAGNWTGYVASGGVIRPHTNGNTASATLLHGFTVSRVA